MPAWRKASRSGKLLAFFASLGRSVRDGTDGEGPGEDSSESEREESLEEGGTGASIIDCPECGSAAFVNDLGAAMPGIGMCGHEYVFRMVKIFCVDGHRLDALDEVGSIHDPLIECEANVTPS